MALRNILTKEEPLLYKKCRPVTAFNARLHQLLDDMADTMYEADGVGLAAPQVGVLKRAVVIDVGEGLIELVNPEILWTEGEAISTEGCLSVPGKHAEVTRPMKVTVRAFDAEMKEFTLTAEGLEARCILHENDHLNGILYADRAEGPLEDNAAEEA